MSAFPRERPPTLDVPKAIRTHDWQAFSQLTSMHNHWDRPGWTAGRRSYHWMLSFDNAENVLDLAQRCQVQLPHQNLDLVPPNALHITMGRIAFTDELSLQSALVVAEQARVRCERLASFRLAIGPLAGSAGALRFSVTPWSQLLPLHQELTTATRAMLGNRCTMDTAQFRPHLSIAYANAAVPLDTLLPVLKPLRGLPPAEVAVSSVELVELWREDRTYQYDELRVLSLAG